MNKTTFKDYKQAVKEQYQLAKTNDVSGILENPTPAKLREFCRFLYDKGLTRSDEEVFRLFFEFNENEDVRKAIDRVSIDKFKSIISFLKGEKETENSIRVELAAIMVDFKKRPYRIFSKSEQSEMTKEQNHVVLPVVSEPNEQPSSQTKSKSKSIIFWIEKNKFITIFLIIASLLGGFSLAKFVFPEKECMQWQNDRYQVVDCIDPERKPSENNCIPLEKSLLNFRKVEVSDTTVFFNKHGKPLFWYCKVKGKTKPDFFNSYGNGYHPETGKKLHPITQYIINRYVLVK